MEEGWEVCSTVLKGSAQHYRGSVLLCTATNFIRWITLRVTTLSPLYSLGVWTRTNCGQLYARCARGILISDYCATLSRVGIRLLLP